MSQQTLSEQAPAKSNFRFPSAFTVLFGVAVAVWLLAFIIPAGTYEMDDEGRPIPGTYQQIDSDLSFTDRLYDLFLSPVNGLYGIESGKTGFIGPYESGELFGAAGVFLFVLAIGVFITVVMTTGAIDNGIARLAHRMKTRGILLIVVIMFAFSVGGTTEGMAEETLGFYALVVPLVLSLGYDRLTAVAVIILGAGIGTLASTVNPFATGVASAAAEISIGDGIVLRFIMYIVLTAVAIAYVVRYAHRVKLDPSKSIVGFREEDAELVARGTGEPPILTGKQKGVLGLVALTFAFMIFSLVPWAQVFQGSDAESYTWQLDWYFPELAALFIVMAIVVGLIGGLGEKKLTDTIVSGAGDFIGAGLIIVIARGVTVIMNNSDITDTILNALEGIVSGLSSGVFAVTMFIVNIPLAFLIPSSSGHATVAMPVLAPLADFAGVSRAIVVTAYQSASGWMNLFTPTSAVVMGGLVLGKVGYDKWLRFLAPLLALLLVLISVFLVIGVIFEIS